MNVRDIKLVRIVSKPLFDWRTGRAHKQYLASPDCFYLKTLKGIHAGQRCFIIGNGPSLSARDLDQLCHEYTFAANRIFNIFSQTEWRPTYYMSMDDRVLNEVQHKLMDYELGHMFLRWGICKIKEPTNKLTRVFQSPLKLDINRNRYNDTSSFFSEDVSTLFCGGRTVTFVSIQFAVYMGFTEIYLLGVDHNYSVTYDTSGKIHVDTKVKDYFDNKRYVNTYIPSMQSVQYDYEIAKEYCDNHGIKIYNATRGGRLEVFERKNFDNILGGSINKYEFVLILLLPFYTAKVERRVE